MMALRHDQTTLGGRARRHPALWPALALALSLWLAACGGARTATVRGQVVAVDTGAQTFRLRADNGVFYEFKAQPGGLVSLVHVKEHQDNKQEIRVEFVTTTEPFEARFAD